MTENNYKNLNKFLERVEFYKGEFFFSELEINNLKNLFIKFYTLYNSILNKTYPDRCNLFSYDFFIKKMYHYINNDEEKFKNLNTYSSIQNEIFTKTCYELGIDFN